MYGVETILCHENFSCKTTKISNLCEPRNNVYVSWQVWVQIYYPFIPLLSYSVSLVDFIFGNGVNWRKCWHLSETGLLSRSICGIIPSVKSQNKAVKLHVNSAEAKDSHKRKSSVFPLSFFPFCFLVGCIPAKSLNTFLLDAKEGRSNPMARNFSNCSFIYCV